MRAGWVNADGWPTAGEWQAFGVMGTLVVALAAAVIAFHQFRDYRFSQEALSRPYVLVDVTFRSLLAVVTIQNASARAAADLTMTVEPAFVTSRDEDTEVLNRAFNGATTIGLLAPGRRINYLFDVMPTYLAGPYPRQYVVTTRYRDGSTGAPSSRKVRWYTDSFTLDLDQWTRALMDEDPVKDLVKHAEAISKAVVRLADEARSVRWRDEAAETED